MWPFKKAGVVDDEILWERLLELESAMSSLEDRVDSLDIWIYNHEEKQKNLKRLFSEEMGKFKTNKKEK